VVDQTLVVTAASLVHLVAEPIQKVVIEADGHPGLAGRDREHGSPFALAEVIFLLHKFS
jgi:hypothetical protein